MNDPLNTQFIKDQSLKTLIESIEVVVEPTEIDPLYGRSSVAFAVAGKRFACGGETFARVTREWRASGVEEPTTEQLLEGAMEWCLDFVRYDGTIYFGNFS